MNKTRRDYCLPVYFNAEERAILRTVAAARGLRGGTLVKLLLHDEMRRLGLKQPDGAAPRAGHDKHQP